MRFIENPDLREWVKESLCRVVFQKAHELAVQTGCEILVKLQGMTDLSGQFYATRTLQHQYQGKGLYKQPWDVQVSGITGLPQTSLIDRGCQSDEVVTHEENVVTMRTLDNYGTAGTVASLEPHEASSMEPNEINTHSLNSVKQEETSCFNDSFGSCSQHDQANLLQYGQEEDTCRQNVPVSETDEDTVPAGLLAAGRAYPIGFPITKLHSVVQVVGTGMQQDQPDPAVGTQPKNITEVEDKSIVRKPYQCGICKRTFRVIQTLSRHAQLNHSFDRRMSYECYICGQSFKLAQYLQRHTRMHQSIMPYVCLVCKKGFFNRASLLKHEETHVEKYHCTSCPAYFPCKSDLQKHTVQAHRSMETVAATGTNYENAPALSPTSSARESLLMSETVTMLSVVPANEQFTNIPTNNFEHFLSDEGPSSGSSRKAVFPQLIKDSASPTLAESPGKCDDLQLAWQGSDLSMTTEPSCSTTLSSTSISSPADVQYQSAVQRHRGGLASSGGNGSQSATPFRFGRNRYACHLCGKSYKYNFTLKEHLITHASVPQFVCKICGAAFTRQRMLRDHAFRHTGTYPYNCELCGKGFIRPSMLKRHQTDRHRLLHEKT